MAKPKVRFCWECGNKLWGNHHVTAVLRADGHRRTLHKSCFESTKGDFLTEDEAKLKEMVCPVVKAHAASQTRRAQD